MIDKLVYSLKLQFGNVPSRLIVDYSGKKVIRAFFDSEYTGESLGTSEKPFSDFQTFLDMLSGVASGTEVYLIARSTFTKFDAAFLKGLKFMIYVAPLVHDTKDACVEYDFVTDNGKFVNNGYQSLDFDLDISVGKYFHSGANDIYWRSIADICTDWFAEEHFFDFPRLRFILAKERSFVVDSNGYMDFANAPFEVVRGVGASRIYMENYGKLLIRFVKYRYDSTLTYEWEQIFLLNYSELIIENVCRSSGVDCVGTFYGGSGFLNFDFNSAYAFTLYIEWHSANSVVDMSSHVYSNEQLKIKIEKITNGYFVLSSDFDLVVNDFIPPLYINRDGAIMDMFSRSLSVKSGTIVFPLPSSTTEENGFYVDENGFVKINRIQ